MKRDSVIARFGFMAGVSILSLAAAPRDASAATSDRAIQPEAAASSQGGTPSARDPAVAAPPATSARSDGVEDIVVTARRVSESAQSVPVSLTAVSGAQLTRLGVTTIADVQKIAPNLLFQSAASNRSAYQVSIRGQVTSETLLTQDSTVGIYVDGVYIPRTTGLRASLVDVARVEVLRGPQGTLYGRNTTGGAVSTYTQDPIDQLEGYGRVRIGTYAERDALLVGNLPISGINGAIRIVADKGSNHGYGHDAIGDRIGSEDREYGRIKLTSEPIDGLKIDLSADYGKYNSGSGAQKLGLIPASLSSTGVVGGLALTEVVLELGLNRADPASYVTALNAVNQQLNVGKYNDSATRPADDRAKAGGAAATIAYDLSSEIKLKSISGYRHVEHQQHTDFGGTSFTFLKLGQNQTDNYYSEEVQLIGSMDRINWVVGGYYGYEKGNSSSLDTVSIPRLNPSVTVQENFVTNTNLSGYAQAGYKLTDDLVLTGGIRYSSEGRRLVSYSRNQSSCTTNGVKITSSSDPVQRELCRIDLKATYNTFSFLGSLDYKVLPNILLYAKVSRGYVSGGENERGSYTSPQSQRPFSPERATQYEIGEKADLLGHRLRINTAAFYTQYANIQRVINLPPGTIQAVVNAASARIYGFEGEANLQIVGGLALNGSVGYTNARYKHFVDLTGDRTNEPFAFPKWSFSVGANQRLETSLGVITTTINYHWQDDVDLYPSVVYDAQVTQKAYGLLDARISFNIKSWNADFAIFGQNLMNKYYLYAANGVDASLGLNNLIYGPPRTAGVELTLHFK